MEKLNHNQHTSIGIYLVGHTELLIQYFLRLFKSVVSIESIILLYP